jgi:hypothetical protein
VIILALCDAQTIRWICWKRKILVPLCTLWKIMPLPV